MLIFGYGYGLEVKRINDFSIRDFGFSYKKEELPDISDYEEQDNFTYKTRTQILGGFIKNYRKAKYYRVKVYFGEQPCVIITPVEYLPQIQSKESLIEFFGKHFQKCYCHYVEFYTTFENNIIPSDWYKRFADYRNRIFNISVNRADGRILVQATDRYINNTINSDINIQDLLNRIAEMEKNVAEITAENIRLKAEIDVLSKNDSK